MFATAGQIAATLPTRRSTSLVATVALWAARANQRRTLAALTTAELKDIGVAPADATAEAAKPFWVA